MSKELLMQQQPFPFNFSLVPASRHQTAFNPNEMHHSANNTIYCIKPFNNNIQVDLPPSYEDVVKSKTILN